MFRSLILGMWIFLFWSAGAVSSSPHLMDDERCIQLLTTMFTKENVPLEEDVNPSATPSPQTFGAPTTSISDSLKGYFQLAADFWDNPNIKKWIITFYNKKGEEMLRVPSLGKKDNQLKKDILTSIAVAGLTEMEELSLLKILGFKLTKSEEPILSIPYLTSERFPVFFEEGYSPSKSKLFWENDAVKTLKAQFFPRAVELFFKPYNPQAYDQLAEDVMGEIKKLNFFKKKDGTLFSLKTSNFMRSLGLSALNLSNTVDQDILIGGTRILGQIIPKIHLGKNNRRKIMLYHFEEEGCLVKNVKPISSDRPAQTPTIVTGNKRSFSGAFPEENGPLLQKAHLL